MESYEEIYERMLETYNGITGNYPDEASDAAIKLKVLAGEIFSCRADLDYIKRQAFIETAEGEYLDYHGRQRGLERKQALRARGSVIFNTDYALKEPLTIPKGTVVAAAGGSPVMFETDVSAVIPAGESSVAVACTACSGGAEGNVAPDKIAVLVTSAGAVTSVTNPEGFTGGENTENDERFRKRIYDTVRNVSDGVNAAYYKKLALSVEGVDGAGVVPLNRGAGTVDVFITENGAAASEELVARVQSVMDEKREINADVLVSSASQWTITLSFTVYIREGYDFNTVKNNCDSVVRNYVNSLGVGEAVYSSEISRLLYTVEGVENHRITSSDKFPSQKNYAAVTSISITKGVVYGGN